jgi:O-antigen/teichoic acid export membrane protein
MSSDEDRSQTQAIGDVAGPASSLATRAVATYGANLAVAFISFANVLLTARMLGPSGRGEVAFLTAIAMLSANIALFGIGEANANLAGKRPGLRPTLFSNSVLFSAGFGLLAILIVAGLVATVPAIGGGASTHLLVAALVAIPILILQAYLMLLAQAEYGFAWTNIAWVLGPVVNVSVNGLLAASGRLTVGTVVVTWVAGQALGLAVLVVYLVRRPGGAGRPDAALARDALAFGARTHIGRVMMMGNYRLDQWILGAVAGPTALGLYSVAVAWAETLFYLPTSVVMAQRPDLVRASRGEARSLAARSFRAALMITGLLGIALFVLAPFLVVGLFGDEFDGSIVDLRLLLFGALGMVSLKVFSGALTAQGFPLLSSAGISIALVVTVVLDIALIPRYDDLGASIASMAAYTIGGLGIALIFVRTVGGTLSSLLPRWRDAAELGERVRTVAQSRRRPS